MADKVILTNETALAAKYGAGLSLIQTAVQQLIAADGGRGLQTVYVPLDDATIMGQYGSSNVTIASDEQQSKMAIDAVYRALAPGTCFHGRVISH